MLRRPLATLGAQPGGSLWFNLLLLVLRAIVALIPTAVFAGAAYGILGLLAPGPLTRDLAPYIVLAFVAVRGVPIVGHDRKPVLSGTRVSVRVDLAGRPPLQKKHTPPTPPHT